MSDPRLHKAEYEVRPVSLAVAESLVQKYHYAQGGSNTATYCHGLFRKGSGIPLGVAWWLPPTRSCAEASYDGNWRKVLSLSRLVIAPDVPHNAASFLIGQSIKAIKAEGNWECLLTYADDRMGHTGAIYRATNWQYVGLTSSGRFYVDQDGRTVARKAGPRTRTHEEMLALGCTFGTSRKHKFRMLLGIQRKREPLTLFPAD